MEVSLESKSKKGSSFLKRRKELLSYAKNFDKHKRMNTIIINSKTKKVLNDAKESYTEETWVSFFDSKLAYKKLDDTYYYHHFENETFIFKISKYGDIYFFCGFFIERSINNRLQLLTILTNFVYGKGSILQHG